MIDSHVHIGRYGRWESDIEQLLKQMEDFGITCAVASDMAINTYDTDGSITAPDKTQIQLNRAALSKVESFAEKLKLLFWIRPLMDIVSDELYECLSVNDFTGLKVHPRTAGLPFSSENYIEYIRICEELKLPFVIHTERDGFSDIETVYRAAIKHPDVRFVAVHMNLGTNHEEAYKYISECDNLYGDTTLVSTADVLRAIKVCRPDKIMFGSDACIFGADSYSRYNGLHQAIEGEFGSEAAAKVFGKNAKKVFGGRL